MRRECFLLFKKLTFCILEMLLKLILVSKSVCRLMTELGTLILLSHEVFILIFQRINFGL